MDQGMGEEGGGKGLGWKSTEAECREVSPQVRPSKQLFRRGQESVLGCSSPGTGVLAEHQVWVERACQAKAL